MRFSVIYFAALAGLVAAQTDPAGQCIQTCFTKVGQDNPDSSDFTRCQAHTDGLQQLLCLCRSAPLVDAFTTCAGESCPEFAAQANGTAICQSSQTGALDPSSSGDTWPSDTASGAGADPANPASGTGASNTESGAAAGGTQTPTPMISETDADSGVRSRRVAMLDFIVGGVVVVLASGLLI